MESIIKFMENLKVDLVAINKKLCPNVRIRRICDICKRYCPMKAIKLSRDIDLDHGRCVGCGICSTVCPNGVFEMVQEPDLELLDQIERRLGATDTLTFICSKCDERLGPVKENKKFMKDKALAPGLVEVPCLARIQDAILVHAWTEGAANIRFNKDHCGQNCICHENAMKAHERTLEIANHFVKALSTPLYGSKHRRGKRATNVKRNAKIKVDTEVDTPDRRQFLARGVGSGITEVINFTLPFNIDLGLAPKKKKVKLPHWAHILPAKRQILLQIARRHKMGDYLVKRNPKKKMIFPMVDIRIGEPCNGCKICCSICPTGALRKVKKKAADVLYFNLGKCTACTLCSMICPEGAVSMNNIVNLRLLNKKGREIHRILVSRCKKCGRRYPASEDADLCIQCGKRSSISRSLEMALDEQINGSKKGTEDPSTLIN